MPKFIAAILVVKTFETFADTPEQGREYVKLWQEGESEDSEPGVKVTRYKLEWEEFNQMNPEAERNMVLQSFLDLMKKIPPGVKPTPSQGKKEGKIIHPFTFEVMPEIATGTCNICYGADGGHYTDCPNYREGTTPMST